MNRETGRLQQVDEDDDEYGDGDGVAIFRQMANQGLITHS